MTEILKKLGPVPFWKGEEKCLPALDAIYRRAADKARETLAMKTQPENATRQRARGVNNIRGSGACP